MVTFNGYLRKAAKKFFFSAPATKRGGGVTAMPIRKKNFFRSSRKKFSKKNVNTNLEGGGVRPLKKRTLFFCGFPHVY